MNKKLLSELKEKLAKEKTIIEETLGSFAKKDPGLKDNWNAKYPEFDSGHREEEEDEVEEYITRLPVEYSLETRLVDINKALDKIKKGIYGNCEKCKKKIDDERLKAYPEARFCARCEGIKKK